MAAALTSRVIVKDMGWERIRKELLSADRSFVKVGYPGEDSKPHFQPTEKGRSPSSVPTGMTMAQLAMLHEHGSSANGLPPRPFMKQTADANMDKAKELSRRLYRSMTQGRISVYQGLGRLGEWYVGQTKRMLRDGNFSPLKASTVARKRSSRPLIDTGQLRNSVVSRVIMNGGVK